MNQKWLMPANPNIYDIDRAVKELGEICWTPSAHFEPGDEVYVYISKPQSCVKYKAIAGDRVSAADQPDDQEYWINKELGKVSRLKDGVMLRFTAEFPASSITFRDLKENGMKGNLQSAMRFYSKEDGSVLPWAKYILSREDDIDIIRL